MALNESEEHEIPVEPETASTALDHSTKKRSSPYFRQERFFVIQFYVSMFIFATVVLMGLVVRACRMHFRFRSPYGTEPLA